MIKPFTKVQGTLQQEDLSTQIVSHAFKHKFLGEVALVHKTKGYEVIGDGYRHTSECYGVIYHLFDSKQGRWFYNQAEAQEAFDILKRNEVK